MEKNGGFHESVFLKFNVICIDILLELVYKIVEKVLILWLNTWYTFIN